MSIIAILITSFLEQRAMLVKIREVFWKRLEAYVAYFTARPVTTQRELRLVYILACIPVIVVLAGVKLLLLKHYFTYSVINIILFILSVQILTWKEEAKNEQAADKRSFVTTYSMRCFAPLFWFLVLPSAIGSICYLIIICISEDFKSKNLDSMIYNVVVDKMLFYASVIPYTVLFIFIALAGNFEEVTHYILEQRKSYTKSFYFLENMLNEIVLISVGKGKFQIGDIVASEEIEAGGLDEERFTPEITAYIVAILYRAGLFFIGVATLICIAKLF